MHRASKKREQQQNGMPEVIREQITMAGRRVLTTWLPMKVRAVTRFEWTRTRSVSVTHEHLQTVYGDEVMLAVRT
ncbi:hypothetical protein TNCV_4779861 [Trichonephila clavipes]|nr:hypothetical protein TNCV_4779861 [Trichonephila clavipes]